PNAITKRKGLDKPRDIREERARDTLCRVIGQRSYQSYLKKGFIVVTGKSGLRYQIFPGGGFTKVYKGGELVESLCVVLRGDFPPTDSLIMRYLLILNDENKFRGYAYAHPVYPASRNRVPVNQAEPPKLSELYEAIKPRHRRAVAVGG
ncbi:MAG: hypothetical protein ACREGR_04365, partial [Minisyncoccia bacterium]